MMGILSPMWCLSRKIVIVSFLLAAPAIAEEPDIRGVGLLDFGTTGGCTGTLIAPDLVLTAAHCLQGKGNEKPLKAENVKFRPSTATGKISGGFRGLKFAIHPVFQLPGLDPRRRLNRDIAVLKLQDPVPKDLATPLRTGAVEELSGKGFVISFRGKYSTARQRVCPPITIENGLMELACEVKSGNSGAPYLALVNGELVVVGVISSRTKIGRQNIALAPVLDAGFGGLLEAMRSLE